MKAAVTQRHLHIDEPTAVQNSTLESCAGRRELHAQSWIARNQNTQRLLEFLALIDDARVDGNRQDGSVVCWVSAHDAMVARL